MKIPDIEVIPNETFPKDTILLVPHSPHIKNKSHKTFLELLSIPGTIVITNIKGKSNVE